MYTVGEQIYSEKSPKNKKIIELFLERELKAEITSMVEYILDTGTTENCHHFGGMIFHKRLSCAVLLAEAMHCPKSLSTRKRWK